MSKLQSCGVCGSGNAKGYAKCWVCGATPGQAPAGASPLAPTPEGTAEGRGLRALGWTAFLIGMAFVTLLVSVELALEWPGLLIPYAAVVLGAFVALARTAYAHIKRGGTDESVTGSELAQGIALGAVTVLVVLAALLLLFIAAIVIFFAICLVVLGGAMTLH